MVVVEHANTVKAKDGALMGPRGLSAFRRFELPSTSYNVIGYSLHVIGIIPLEKNLS
jgi:hypothetical protein